MGDERVIVEVTPGLIKAARLSFRASLSSDSYKALRAAIESDQPTVTIPYKGKDTELQTGNFKPMIRADQAIEDELKKPARQTH